jgi:hypothetical protein
MNIARIFVFTIASLPLFGAPEIVYEGKAVVSPAADGGIPPVVGVQNIQVVRSNRTQRYHADGLNHTYLHAPMLAYWRGKFYLDYLSAPVSEHETPTPTSYTTSKDGVHWDEPKLLFPSFALPDGQMTLTHQRMSFYISPSDRLLATAFHGKAPSPNDGTGIGRVVREIKEDGSLGPIYFIRYNTHAGYNESNTPYPHFTRSSDAGFVEACQSLLSNKLVTAQWWEEDQSEDGFYSLKGKAISIFHRADGKAVAVAKDAQHAISSDEGKTWTRLGFMGNMPVNSSKYWAQKTSDGTYALILNPTARLRHPLSSLTSKDGKSFNHLRNIHSELPDQRFPGKYKNMGPQYVRGISEGNGTPPDGSMWLTYSVNKEDIWVSRVPVPLRGLGTAEYRSDFSDAAVGSMPTGWNIYRPLWAPVQIVDSDAQQGRALELRDEDPVDYASATRVFTPQRGVRIQFKVLPKQTNARLEVDVLHGEGLRPVQMALTEKGAIEGKHEGIWMPGGSYVAGAWIQVELRINDNNSPDRFKLLINGKEALERTAYFSELAPHVERITFRTGHYRYRGEGGHVIAGADEKASAAAFLIDDVVIEPLKAE